MIFLTHLPSFVRYIFKGMPGTWKRRHQLFFCWIVVMQAVFPGKKTLTEMARYAPNHITEWRFRRLLKAGYLSIRLIVIWFAQEAAAAFPPPEDGVIFIISDSSEKNKRGEKNPCAQKGRKSKNKPWFFGIRFVVLMLSWDVYRIPADFRIILPKKHRDYKKENELFREMLQNFRPPEWTHGVIVMGDCAYASKDNMKMIQQKDKSDRRRSWRFVFAIAKTWKTKDGQFAKNIAWHTPHKYFKRTWIPALPEGNGRKTFYVFRKNVCLRHIGEVTLVLSRKRLNEGPGKTRLIVTNLTGLTARQILCIYNRRWSVEILFKELKSGLGLGEHQVYKDEKRVENSIGVAVIAYLFLIRISKNDITPCKSWSIFQLQNNFRLKIMRKQIEHDMELKLKLKNLKKAA